VPDQNPNDLFLYSTLSRRVEPFTPLEPGKVKMYACGVTVYDDAHIGHARQAIVFDVLRNHLEALGYQVTYVRNFTDVDDKIIDRAIQRGVPASDVSKHFIAENSKDLAALGVASATYEPKVTDHIADIISVIGGLVAKECAYMAGGDVLFDVSRFPEYGKLSNRRLEDCLNSDSSAHKRQPQDFVLWKAAKPGEPYWESPWGPGRPGWHIECSALVQVFLGKSIDIHGGGTDLIFPHHENEIAQSEALNSAPLARYWLHNGLVTVNGRKMSKSTGNVLTIKDALGRHHPEVVRLAVLSFKYSSDIDFNESLFSAAACHLSSMYRTLQAADQVVNGGQSFTPHVSGLERAAALRDEFRSALNSDFNTATALAAVSVVISDINKTLADSTLRPNDKAAFITPVRDALIEACLPLGVLVTSPAEFLESVKRAFIQSAGIKEEDIESAIAARRAAKRERRFADADAIRADLSSRGVILRDGPRGLTTWDVESAGT
jgi:cysteinyl-tRNA synthetase